MLTLISYSFFFMFTTLINWTTQRLPYCYSLSFDFTRLSRRKYRCIQDILGFRISVKKRWFKSKIHMHSKHSVLNNLTVFLSFYAFLVKSLELLKLQWLYVAVLHVAIVRVQKDKLITKNWLRENYIQNSTRKKLWQHEGIPLATSTKV